ncbi:MAG: YfhO family protein, partial [Lachnospiraceae bacterium]|nr:YfhO family protein [Lachnospiraceae bacterium]
MSFLTGVNDRVRKHPCLAAFILSLIMLLFYSIIQGIFPFGSVTYLRKDLYHQYLPFLYEFRRRLLNGESLKYSFDLGLGSSFYAMYVYYLSDPLNFLSVLVPEDFLLEFLTVITYIKIAAASAFMCAYLRYRCPKLSFSLSVPLSLCYGFSGYMAAFGWNVMWMWGTALAPLVIMGFEKLIKGQGSRVYLAAMAATVWTNYYIAMVMGIFLALYFFIVIIEEKLHLSSVIRAFFKAFVMTALAGGISAVLLMPEWVTISSTPFVGKSFPQSLKLYLSLPELMSRSLMAVKAETGLGHEPALYASLVLLFLLPLFFLNKKVPLRVRLTRLILILFFYLSFDLNVLEFIWHGLNYPDSIPARQAFLFVFICISSSAMGLDGIADMGGCRIAAASAFPVIFYTVCIIFCRSEEHTDVYTWVLSAVFIIMYGLLLFLFIVNDKFFSALSFMAPEASGDKRYGFAAGGTGILAMVMITELFFSFNITAARDVSRKAYFKHVSSYKRLAEEGNRHNRLNQGLFTRFDTVDENIRNISSLAGYGDASYFSSTIDSDITDFYKLFGMKASRVHYMGEGLTPFTSALMGIGYFLANDFRNNQTDFDTAEFTDEADGDYLYESLYSLPFGYSIPEREYGHEAAVAFSDDPIALQNHVSERLGGEELFCRAGSDCIEEEEGRAVITIPGDGHYYALAFGKVGSVKEYTDFSDEPYGIFKDMKYESIMDLGRLDKGTVVTLEAETEEYPDIALYRLVPENLKELIRKLSEESLTLTEFKEDHIEGIAEVSGGRALLLTLPLSEGWEITLDGSEKITPEGFYGLFPILSLPAGVHHISLDYHIPYFMQGLSVTVLSV